MQADDLARLTLLGFTLFGCARVVRAFWRGQRAQGDALRAFAAARAAPGSARPWRRGYAIGDEGHTRAFCADVFTEGTLRGGVVDVWRVRQEHPALRGFACQWVRRGAEGRARIDLEGAKRMSSLSVEGHAPESFSHPEVEAACDAFLRRFAVRSLAADAGALEVCVERRLATPQELGEVLDALGEFLGVYARHAGPPVALPEAAPGPRGIGAQSGAPVWVPLQTGTSSIPPQKTPGRSG